MAKEAICKYCASDIGYKTVQIVGHEGISHYESKCKNCGFKQ